MCLLKTHKVIRTAYHDIPVYKVLTEDNYAPYIKNYHYTPGLNSPMEPKPKYHFECTIIESGFLHAWTSEYLATHNKKVHEAAVNLGYVSLGVRKCFKVVKMYIPKGSGYYEGTDGDICTEWLYWPEEDTAQPDKD